MLTRFKRISTNKIFVSKAEVKHTASKVIITLYIYNEERRTLFNRLKRLETMLFPSFKSYYSKSQGNKILSLRDKINLINQEKDLHFYDSLNVIKKSILESIQTDKNLLETIKEPKLRSEKLREIVDLEKKLKNILAIITISKDSSILKNSYLSLHDKFINKTLLEKEIATLAYYKLLLNLNKYKFEDKLISKLKPVISRIYNKEIEFNIVNIKAIYLNSDIFTQAISLKLENRNNGLLKVMKRFLYLVKLPKVKSLSERYAYIDIKKLWINKIKNLNLKSLNFSTKKDSINVLLDGLFSNSNFIDKAKPSIDLINPVLDNLRHKKMAGVRLEAKGRLTRRLTASRSIFKIRWKGSLKNVYSSYRGLSSVLLRGHVKSNVNYSIINSKTRNGAFGIKG
jgi:Mitochondrial ribosomal protein (VAR1)